MDEGNNNKASCEGNEDSMKSHRKRVKPPDKNAHQLEMAQYTELILKKEALLKSLNMPKRRRSSSTVHGNREELIAKQRTLIGEKQNKWKQKQAIDAELKTLNEIVMKKNETCMKLQANVKHKDEQRTNNAIKNLEFTLSTRQLKLSEEKKLVCEIDALKRSKKTLREYLSAKQELDQLRVKQNRLRSERDVLMRESHVIRAMENDVKVSLDTLKDENKDDEEDEEKKPLVDADTLKKEIQSLYEQQCECRRLYKQESMEYYEQKQIERDLQQKKVAEQRRDQTRLSKISADRVREEKRLEPRPYEEEKNICVCLINYLEPLIAHGSSESDEVDAVNKTSPRYIDAPKFESSIPEEGSFVMKTDPDDNLGGLFVPSCRRITRKGSRKGRKSKDLAQKLVLHPHVFEQFLKLNLEPPSTNADVPGILEKLREKKVFYEKESSVSKRSPKVEAKQVTDQITIAVKPSEHATQLSSDKQRSEKTETRLSDGTEAQHEISTDVHVTGVAQSTAKQVQHADEQPEHEAEKTENEMVQLQRDSGNAEHEAGQPQHESEQTEHDVNQTRNESEKDEHEVVRSFTTEKDQITSNKDIEDEDMAVFKNERNSCEDEQIPMENIYCPTIITDALEKGIDSINIKESSQEIQVRVT
ncbi:nuclear mitotic apparatus protein 1-like [Dendronephthya gigantea]|uniref:nuclear mitotic apparatus protein 1-like n=1 Tax=Dendronephthya gigantea TaxID=151771 RepID=UPI001069B60F|nr:nuclear mitotic apparatus protein 1-like [Dendronephthya gigantea]